MRILTIVDNLGPGGTQRVAQNCAIAYQEHGHSAAVLARRGGGPREAPLEEAAIKLFIGGEESNAASQAIEQAILWKPDVIHIHRPGPAYPETGRVLERIQDASDQHIAVMETNHFARVDFSSDRDLIDLHLQLSRWCLWKWRKWSRGLRPRPLGTVVPHMIRPDSFYRAADEDRAAFRAKHGIPTDAIVFGRLGQPLWHKWSPVMIDAFAAVAARFDQAYLLLVGMPEKLRERIRTLPEDVARRVKEVPFLHGDDQLRACYSAQDVFLHAALIGESFGLVLCEAMLCGLPVVTLCTPAKDNSQIEVIGHERGGLVVTDGPSMAEGMIRLMNDADLRRRLADQGAAWVKEVCSPERITALLLKLAEMTHESPDRETLAARLEQDPEIVTEVPDDEIRDLLGRSIGRVSARDRILMRLVHVPWVYRPWLWYKSRGMR